MTVLGRVRASLDRLRSELARDDIDRTTRALRVAELSLVSARLSSVIAVGHERFYELTTAPRQFRGLRDLEVRIAGPADAAALSAMDDTPTWRFTERFARGDLAYIGELDGRVLAQSWFHRGPAPFDEDAPVLPRWDVPADAFWSYHAYTLPEARTSGVFVKLFQTALRDLLLERGAVRVRCRVKAANAPSVALHERLGFVVIGTLSALSVPGARLLSWHGAGVARRWIERRSEAIVMALPPAGG
jgi:GNAT superfamily N-acetyltransferase